MSAADHVRLDSCPGVLRLHDAADGALARVRVPGGRISVGALRGLAELADVHADGALELTSRGNVQLRAVARGAEREVASGLAAVGLLPSPSHERVRNIVASPLAGWDANGHGDVDDLVGDLDTRLVNSSDLAELSGRFLFGFDDGRGDVSASVDLGWQAHDSDRGVLVVDGRSSGFVVPRSRAVEVLLVAARVFLGTGQGWRVRHAPATAARLIDGLRATLPELPWASPWALPRQEPPRAGVAAQPRLGVGAVLVAGVPLGRLTVSQVHVLAAAVDDSHELGGSPSAATVGVPGLRFTPWRSVVVRPTDLGAARAALTDAGLYTSAGSAWNGVTACAGEPHCAKANADVRALAARMVAAASREPSPTRTPVHWSGCARRCGRPTSAHVDVLSLNDGGVLVDGDTAPIPARPAEYVAALRETSPSPTRSMERERLHP